MLDKLNLPADIKNLIKRTQTCLELRQMMIQMFQNGRPSCSNLGVVELTVRSITFLTQPLTGWYSMATRATSINS